MTDKDKELADNVKDMARQVRLITLINDIADVCKNCPHNPKNGGSGICNCILGTPKIT